jgi:hypothetical protein
MTNLLIVLSVFYDVARECYNAIATFNESVQDDIMELSDTFYDFDELMSYCLRYYRRAITNILDLGEIFDNLNSYYNECDECNIFQGGMYYDDDYLDYNFDTDLMNEY